MDPLKKLFLDSAYHTLGIVPIEWTGHDINKVLATLPPDEARKMRRKFRKLWRKFAKNPSKGRNVKYLAQLGLGSKDPTRRQKSTRKQEVSTRIITDYVNPMIDTLKTGSVNP